MTGKKIRGYFAEAIDSVDASVFTGDILFNKDEREHLKEHCERWLRAINSHEADPELLAMDNDCD